MLYVLMICGIFLIGCVPYLAIKGRTLKDNTEAYSKQKKAIAIIALIGSGCIIAAIVGLSIDGQKEQKSQPPKITWSLTESSVKNIDTQKLKELLVAFQIACKGWTKYPEAIETAEITVRKFEKSKYESYTQEELGWYTEVELSIKIKNDAKLPTDLRMVPGHTLHYFIGGGKKPGLIMIKDVTALFFGVPASQINTDGHTFVNNEAFKIADELVKEIQLHD